MSPQARSFGPNTSLIVFTRPRPVQTLDAYYRKMWLTLDQLARLDKRPWPIEIPEQVDHPMWEFSFAGEPIFVVCTTPAHVMRQSRRSSAFMLTFQPRWVFEKILGTDKTATAAFGEVRKRLIPYDSASPRRSLGRYGADRGPRVSTVFPPRRQQCEHRLPLRQACAEQDATHRGQGAGRMTQIITGAKTEFAIDQEILNLLPAQGSVELQHDAAGKVHHFHTHPVDEILMIVSGRLNFSWDDEERVVGAGDTILLPAGTRHQSEALEGGAIYVIATLPPAKPLRQLTLRGKREALKTMKESPGG